jgi:hypothetical protein
MIKSVTIINRKGEQIVLTLRSPEQSGFFIKKIEGLGAPIGTINTAAYATIDGSRYISSRSNQRNIVFNLGFLDKPTIEDTRISSYKFFSVKSEITMIFETDIKTVKITGRVETNEPDIFSKESGAIVSVICPNPYFYSMTNDVISFSVLQKLFQFPFSNEDLYIPLTYFGDVIVDAQQTINYMGEVPIGFVMSIDSTGDAGTITVYNLETRESMTIDNDIITSITGTGISAGDLITITTIKGQKSAILSRDGETINILNSVVGSANWFSLDLGPNPFYYTAEFGGSFLLFNINYQLLYEGI